jgi:hypothetical protein
MERLRAWSSPGGAGAGGAGKARMYTLADVEAACNKLLQQAARDAGDADAFAAQQTQQQRQLRGAGGSGGVAYAADASSAPPPAPLALETRQEQTHQQRQEQQQQQGPEAAASGAAPSPPLLAALGAALGASLEGLRDADPCAYLDLLEGKGRPELRARGLAQLRASHDALAAAGAAPPLDSPGDLEALLDAFLAESRARLQVRRGRGG